MRWPRLRRRKTGTEPPNPVDLWQQADGDPDLYAQLYNASRQPDRPVRDPVAQDQE